MANLCDFEMMVKGERKNIDLFFAALTQTGNVWMGRGACADIYYDDANTATISGDCKWSIHSALFTDAVSMREQKETGIGSWAWNEQSDSRDYVTLFEACKNYHVNVEVYSEETGCEFQEHYKYENGETLSDCVDYTEVYNEDTEEYESTGGYESWDFNLADVQLSPNCQS